MVHSLEAIMANCKGPSAKGLSVNTKLLLMNRAVLPPLQYRSSRWPPSKNRSQEIAALQRKMVGSMLRTPPVAGERVEEYMRRRNRLASSFIKDHGDWHVGHCRRALAWDAHCRRERNGNSWASKLVTYRG